MQYVLLNSPVSPVEVDVSHYKTYGPSDRQSLRLESIIDEDCPDKSDGQQECSLCLKIEQLACRDWCFEWLGALNDWKKTSEFTDAASQIHLMSSHCDEEVSRIRAKLATLQTKTVTMNDSFFRVYCN